MRWPDPGDRRRLQQIRHRAILFVEAWRQSPDTAGPSRLIVATVSAKSPASKRAKSLRVDAAAGKWSIVHNPQGEIIYTAVRLTSDATYLAKINFGEFNALTDIQRKDLLDKVQK